MKVRDADTLKSSISHNIPKDIGWANIDENKTDITLARHRALHKLFWILPPHLMIKFIIKIGCKPLREDIKQTIYNILNVEDPVTLYKEWTIKDKDKFRERSYKDLRVDYINK